MKVSQKKNHKPLIALTFDDAFPTDYGIAYPEMTSRNIKGTSYVAIQWVGTSRGCTWNQLKEMKSGGWDLQCHTVTHPRLSELTETQIHAEFQGVNDAFAQNGIALPKHHAYPYGDTDSRVKAIGKQYRLTQRLTGRTSADLNKYEDFWNTKDGVIKGLSVDIQDEVRFNEVKSAILDGVAAGQVMVLYCHQIVPVATEYASQITQSYFIQLLDFIKSLNVETGTISEVYDEVMQ